MSTEQNKALVRRFIEEVWCEWNLAKIDEFCDPNYVTHDPINPGVRNREELKGWMKGISIAFPVGKYVIDLMIAEGDKVVALNPYHGRNTGDFFGFPPTGKEVNYTALCIHRIADGKIVESWWVYDLFSELVQLGLVANPWVPG